MMVYNFVEIVLMVLMAMACFMMDEPFLLVFSFL
jgi:hypothetical protein